MPPREADALAVQMMLPLTLPSTIARAACFTHTAIPRALTLISRSNREKSKSRTFCSERPGGKAALLNMTSSRPYFWTVQSTMAFTCSSSLTSHFTKLHLSRPMDSATATPFSTWMSAMTTPSTNETTVHRQINAGDKRRLVGSQKQDGVSHVLRVWRYAFQANQRPIKFVHEPQSLFGVGRNHGSWSRTGRHRVDPDPVGPQLLARRPDQPKNRVLRHDVVCNPHAAARGRRAGRADDAPPHAPLHHRPRRVLHAHRHPSRVDADKPPAVLLDRPIYHGLHLLFLANVALYKAALVEADGLRHGDALLDLDVGDDHAECAMIGKKASGRFPDAASTAGHYHNFALEPLHGRI
nr:hypothetical protein Iba_scaffold19169CG0010 [Ipomoea batatas]